MKKEPVLLVISDLHFNCELNYTDAKVRDSIYNQFTKKIEKLFDKKNEWTPDYLIITGDIAYRATREDYNTAWDILNPVFKHFNSEDENGNKIIICPGNHDKDLERKDSDNEKYMKELLKSNDFNKLQAFYSNYIGFCEDKLKIKKFDSFHADNFLHGLKIFKEEKLCFVVLNSSWLCSKENYYGKLELGVEFIDSINAKIKDEKIHEDYAIITLFHHPFNWLSWNDRFNEKQIVEKIIDFSDLILYGHEHVYNFSVDSLSNMTQAMNSGTLFSVNKGEGIYKNNFSLIKLNSQSFNTKHFVFDSKSHSFETVHEKKYNFTRTLPLISKESIREECVEVESYELVGYREKYHSLEVSTKEQNFIEKIENAYFSINDLKRTEYRKVNDPIGSSKFTFYTKKKNKKHKLLFCDLLELDTNSLNDLLKKNEDHVIDLITYSSDTGQIEEDYANLKKETLQYQRKSNLKLSRPIIVKTSISL